MDIVFQERLSDAPFVERVWRTQSEWAGSFLSLASSQWEIVIARYRDTATFTIRGPETKATPADFPAEAEYLGIVFKLGTFMPHLPTANRIDRNDVVLPAATGNSFWLNSSTWHLPNYENADTFVSRLVHENLLVRDPVVDAVLQDQHEARSLRSLQYRFLRATGLTHKLFQQIERARRARKLLKQGSPILDTVHETGYFDQAHLTNSLRRFLGQTPAQITRINQPSSVLEQFDLLANLVYVGRQPDQ